ncbi:SH3 domain-containing protein [Clostridioides difficile]|uniref:SH3 domain-containing protein n=1 Tax=Clostridioides difficile TaxID=1496 RepID=UPI002030141E|nr:SH3 domain-containing protein [Clostridioides difficile]MCM0737808.1 SH3 domain-containing protein [Clostridioides difficile]
MISELMLKNFGKSSINFKTKIKLNLREKPDINSLKLKSIPEGKIVKLKCVDGIWAEVESNYDKGWLLYKYLERLSNAKNNSNDTIKNRKKNYIGNIRTNGLSLELRSDRTLESKVITTILMVLKLKYVIALENGQELISIKMKNDILDMYIINT